MGSSLKSCICVGLLLNCEVSASVMFVGLEKLKRLLLSNGPTRLFLPKAALLCEKHDRLSLRLPLLLFCKSSL